MGNLKPTVMDKAEEAKKEISQLRIKRQNAIDDARITYLEGFIAGSEHAQQVNGEERKKLAMQVWHDSRINVSIPEEKDRIIFDSYWQNKEESNG